MKKLEVRFTRQPGEERVVGQLAEAGPRPASRRIYFEYDPAFLRDPLWLSKPTSAFRAAITGSSSR